MTAIIFITTLALLVALISWCTWMYDVPISHIPDTESEKYVRDLKMRIADTEWKFHRELDKYR